MNEIINVNGIDCYEEDGVAYLKLETVARGLGFTRIANSGNKVVMWSRVDKYLKDLGVHTSGHDGFIPENVFYRLAMKAKNSVAETFMLKVANILTTMHGNRSTASCLSTQSISGLVNIRYDNDKITVSARELHGFLEVGSEFSHWFKRMCEYGFTEGQDFSSFLTESTGGRPAQDAQLTIDMAKEICMLQRNEKGKQARQYFIQLEKDWNSPEKVMARALQIANRQIHFLESENAQQKQLIAEYQPKAVFADSVAASSDTILVRELAKIICQNGVKIGQNRLFRWMRENGFLIRKSGRDYNMPTQYSLEHGLMCVSESSYIDAYGEVQLCFTPRVTAKGQQYFVNRFLNKEVA